MTEKRGIGDGAGGSGIAGAEEHYQPWMRNRGDGAARPAPLATRPAAPPPTEPEPAASGTTAGQLSADDLLARPIAIPPAAPAGEPAVGERLSGALRIAGEWTRDMWHRMELPRRGREALSWTGRAGRSAARAVAQTTRSGMDAAAPRIEQASRAAQEALAKGASGAKAGLDSGTSKLGEATRALIASAPLPARERAAEMPESQLDRLLAEGEAERQPASPVRTDGLPLFAPAPVPDAAPGPVAAPSTAASPSPAPATAPASAAPTAPATTAAAGASAAATPAPRGPGAGEVATGGDRPRPPAGAGGSGRPWHRHPGTMLLGGALLLSSGFAAGLYWTGPGVDRATTERVIHDYLLNNPEILPQAMERLERNRAAQVIDRQRDRIERPFSGAWAGAADGDVTMTVFTDYACTFCRASLADIDRLLREDRNLKVVFRELPILSPDSEPAARLALAAARRGRYMPMHRALFETGTPDADARRDAAVNLDVANDSAALGDAAITRELETNVALARDLGIDGTPSWVIGDRMLTGAVGYDQLRAAIRAARSGE